MTMTQITINKLRSLPCILATAACVMTLLACDNGEEKDIERSAGDFAAAYFNLRYARAAELSTPDSEKWIRFKASNITQADLDVYNSAQDTATCTVNGMEICGDSAIVAMTVNNVLVMDSIGKVANICKERDYRLILKKKEGKWAVRLSSVL